MTVRCPHRMSDDRGTTLTEVVVALLLLAIVSAVFLPTLTSGLGATVDLTNAAAANDTARLALQRLDREFRAADRVCTPQPGVAGDVLEFRTRAWTTTTSASGYQEISYRLNGTDLERTADGGVTWDVWVGNVVNATVVDDDYNAEAGRPLGTVGVPVFTTEGGGAGAYPSEGKVVTVRIWTDISQRDRLGPRLLTTELSGRNIWTPNAPGC